MILASDSAIQLQQLLAHPPSSCLGGSGNTYRSTVPLSATVASDTLWKLARGIFPGAVILQVAALGTPLRPPFAPLHPQGPAGATISLYTTWLSGKGFPQRKRIHTPLRCPYGIHPIHTTCKSIPGLASDYHHQRKMACKPTGHL